MATTTKQTPTRRKAPVRRTRRTSPPTSDQPRDEIYQDLVAEAATNHGTKGLIGRLAEWATTSARALRHAVRPRSEHHASR